MFCLCQYSLISFSAVPLCPLWLKGLLDIAFWQYSQPTPRVLHNSYSSQCWPTSRFFLIWYVGQWSAHPVIRSAWNVPSSCLWYDAWSCKLPVEYLRSMKSCMICRICYLLLERRFYVFVWLYKALSRVTLFGSWLVRLVYPCRGRKNRP